MRKKLGVSIIIPYYKGEKYIHNTIKNIEDSVMKSNLEYEIIIVNDNPNEEVDYLTKKNVEVLNNPVNKGVSFSRNIGRSNAYFEYLYFIDQDDYITDDFFVKAEKYIVKKYDVIIFNYLKEKQDKTKKNYNFIFKYYFDKINYIELLKYGNLFKSPGQVIFRKDASIPFLETKTMGADDFYLFLDFFLRKSELKITYIHEPLFIYRIHQDNYTKVADFRKSSLECFQQYKMIRPEIASYEQLLINRYYNNIFLKAMGRIRKLVISL